MLQNTRHERFTQALAQGMPASRAYIEAGYLARGNSAEVNAARLLRNAQVAQRLDELKQEAADRAIVTTEDVLRGLRKEAEGAESDTARVAAWAHLGKHLGIFTEKSEVTIRKDPSAMTDDELEQALRHAGLN